MSDTEGDNGTPNMDATTNPLQDSLKKAGFTPDENEPTNAVYKVLGDSKIAVSSKRGKLWQSRVKAGKKMMGDLVSAWDEAINYYNHDQTPHRDGSDPSHANNRYVSRKLNERHSSTENVVASNIWAQIPELYAKNPKVEFTAAKVEDDTLFQTNDRFARAAERFINLLFGMKVSPGVNLKPKMKKAVLIALLTNRAWLEIGYVQKENSSDEAYQNLVELSQKLAKADDVEDIKEIEGSLRALEEKIEFLQKSGPYVRLRLPHQIVVDPDHNDPWLTDAMWVAIEDMLPTDYLNAIYGERGDDETVRSIYAPTHILDSSDDRDALTEGFSLFSDSKDYNAYGYGDKETFNKAKRTKVWYVWDKATRRLELYTDKDWSWPVWVWDDPYQLSGFFPLFPLYFHENPIAAYAKGEVSYYLDQQDEVNEINDEMNRARKWARRNLFYDLNTGVQQSEIEKILSGPDGTATGIKVPEGKNGKDLIFSITPPSLNYKELFNKGPLYEAINRIAMINDVQRGQEFKTNTTNKAVEYYSSLGATRMDERADAIEDTVAAVGWGILELCTRFMDAETASKIVGQPLQEIWHPVSPLTDLALFSLEVEGGSAKKLTTAAKKQEAMEVGQIMSQFSRAAPATVLGVTMRLFSNAFDDFEITKADWDKLQEEAQQMIQNSVGGAPGAGGGPQQAPGGGGVPGGGGGAQSAQLVVQALSQLPPQVLRAVGVALAQGASPQAILEQMMAGGGVGKQPNSPPPQTAQ